MVPGVGFVLERTLQSAAFVAPFLWPPSRLSCFLLPIYLFPLGAVGRQTTKQVTKLQLYVRRKRSQWSLDVRQNEWRKNVDVLRQGQVTTNFPKILFFKIASHKIVQYWAMPRKFNAALIFQGNPTTVFCKISVPRSKYCLEFSTTWGRLKISTWPIHSCTIFEAFPLNPLRFSEV